MVSGGIIGRLRASCLSRWELGDLLGIHPHQLAHLGPGGLSARLSVEALIELSRRLDMHPADLVADLDTVLANRRSAPEPPKDANPNDAGHGHHGDGQHHRPGQLDGEADALVVLTALAHARTPLRVEDLARAMRWSLGRVQGALNYAQQHQRVAGPLSLRRVPPETFTVSARLDILTAGQHQAIQSTSSWSGILAENEAIVLLAALAYGSGPEYATIRAGTAGWWAGCAHPAGRQSRDDWGSALHHQGRPGG